MQEELIKLSINGTIALIELNRPKQMNALSTELMLDLKHSVETIKNTYGIKVAILTGNEKVFAAGIDIKTVQNKNAMDAMKERFINEDWFAIESLEIPTIAAISGYALGGGFELALMCDMLVADKTSVFGFPEITLGLMPGMGGTQKLPQLINSKVAFQKIILGESFNADDALKYGLIDKIAEPNAIQHAFTIAQKIARLPIESIISIKKAFNTSKIPEPQMQYEREMFRALFDSENKKIGIEAFIAKQHANFK